MLTVTTKEQAIALVNDLYQALDLRRPAIEKAECYYRGEQPLAYASETWSKQYSQRYSNFSDNWCGVVANAPMERVALQGIRVGDSAVPLTDDEKQLWEDWLRNDMEAQSSQGFLQAVMAKRSAVMVWGNDDDEPVVTWEHPAQTLVRYNPANHRDREAALKTWISEDANREYATLYMPDWVWKFERPAYESKVDRDGLTLTGLYVPTTARGSYGWTPRFDDGEEKWPLKNTLGEVPIVEIPNRPMLGGEPISDIAGTMAMQDAINMLWAYLFNAADFASMPQRVVLGMDIPKVPVLDSEGQIISYRPAKIAELEQARIMFMPGAGDKTPTISQWEAAKLDVFTGVIEVQVGHVSAQTRTPPHYLVTNKGLSNLSGDALTAAETGLVKKVEEFQLFSNSPMRTVFRLMAKVRNKAALADAISIARLQWKSAGQHSEAQMADAAAKDASIGLPLAYILERRYGLSQPEIDRIIALKRAEKDLWQPPTTEQIKDQVSDVAPGDAAGAATDQLP